MSARSDEFDTRFRQHMTATPDVWEGSLAWDFARLRFALRELAQEVRAAVYDLGRFRPGRKDGQ